MKVLIATLVIASVSPALAASAPPPGATSCSGCHAAHGAASSAMPRIHGRDASEIMDAMTSFHNGTRPATVMNRIAKGFSDDELRLIAAWLAEQK
ncbi:c-type cytochrome [Tardiphaga sp.]|jgi:cytochrome c553|uniref:c-type cytochrome n=1 Tax=Tardiphaga sp. TaxID=1926292 RepID=UPI0037DA100B